MCSKKGVGEGVGKGALTGVHNGVRNGVRTGVRELCSYKVFVQTPSTKYDHFKMCTYKMIYIYILSDIDNHI